MSVAGRRVIFLVRLLCTAFRTMYLNPRPGNLAATCRVTMQVPWAGLHYIYHGYRISLVLISQDFRFWEI
jgi:hypothetical protein